MMSMTVTVEKYFVKCGRNSCDFKHPTPMEDMRSPPDSCARCGSTTFEVVKEEVEEDIDMESREVNIQAIERFEQDRRRMR